MSENPKNKNVIPLLPLWGTGMGPLPAPPIVTDPNGSYTGRPVDPAEKPVQDADDL